MAKQKERGVQRSTVLGREPMPISELRATLGGDGIEDREDGISGRLDQRAPRTRSQSSEPLPMSKLGYMTALAVDSRTWDMVEQVESNLAETMGRRPDCSTADMVIFFRCMWEVCSLRELHRMFVFGDDWESIRAAVRSAWPNFPERRLSERAPSRFQYRRFCRRHEDFAPLMSELERWATSSQAGIALHTGMFGGGDSLTHPASNSIVVGDGTWVPSMFNTTSDTQFIDKTTGEIIPRRHDPDAVSYHRKDNGPGRMLVSMLARNAHPHERVILGTRFKPVVGDSDATVFTNMVLELQPLLPGLRGIAYDGAMHANDIDRLLDQGLLPICKVQKVKGGKAPTRNMGLHEFKNRHGSSSHALFFVGSLPYIELVIDSEPHGVPLEVQQLRDSENADLSHRIYAELRIPDQVGVPKRLRGATTLFRINSTKEERAASRRRTRVARPFPENSEQFLRLYGLREDAESMHHHMKERLPNGRARSVGLNRQRLDHLSYQLRSGTIALLAWHYRTGGDISPWFGNWLPPPQRRSLAS